MPAGPPRSALRVRRAPHGGDRSGGPRKQGFCGMVSRHKADRKNIDERRASPFRTEESRGARRFHGGRQRGCSAPVFGRRCGRGLELGFALWRVRGVLVAWRDRSRRGRAAIRCLVAISFPQDGSLGRTRVGAALPTGSRRGCDSGVEYVPGRGSLVLRENAHGFPRGLARVCDINVGPPFRSTSNRNRGVDGSPRSARFTGLGLD